MQQSQHDKSSKWRAFGNGTPVLVRNYNQGSHWLQGMIEEIIGSGLMFKVCLNDGSVHCCHGDQLRHRIATQGAEVEEEMERNDDECILHPNVNPAQVLEGTTVVSGPAQIPMPVTPTVKPPHVYPSCVRLPPDRYSPSYTRK